MTTTSQHIIGGRCAYLDYVFGYDDTERIVVRFEIGPSDGLWSVRVLENEKPKTKRFEIIEVEDDWEPHFDTAENILLRYWNGELEATP